MIPIILTAVAVAALVGIDQAIKLWAIAHLQGQPDQPFLQLGSLDWIHLSYLENSGAAFSIMRGNRGFLIVFAVIMISVCFYVLNRLGRTRRWVWFAIPLITAGGIGNLVDRVIRGGKVVDYLSVQFFSFPVFNFADICVTFGVLITVCALLFLEKEEKQAKKANKAARIPFAHTAPALPEAGTLPDAEPLAEAETREVLPVLNEDSDHAGA